MVKISPSEITPESVYRSRRAFMKGIGVLALSGAALSACGPAGSPPAPPPAAAPTATTDGNTGQAPRAGKDADELGNPLNSYQAITSYNNYYEFTTDKQSVGDLARDFKTSPWTVAVGGLVNKPRSYDIDDLRRKFPPQERIYRLRCVEAWSMVIPWLGFPLAAILKEVEPLSSARYVRFETVNRPEEMPGMKDPYFPWPYVEGLRLDEALHDLTILATGLYGQSLLAQNGAPVRLVAPWKYGFKSIKSIVKIDLVEEQPRSLWMMSSPYEYGFYANVNPEVDHPRWSQATERRIGEVNRRPTLMFNGYDEEVAPLYTGMNLRVNY